jgi:hypothetical protein
MGRDGDSWPFGAEEWADIGDITVVMDRWQIAQLLTRYSTFV